MERLQFSGLPEFCQVGPATLLPRNDSEGFLRRCCVCRRVNVNHYLCDSGHTFCPDCVPPSDFRQRWCVICAASVVFKAESLPSSIMDVMIFSCPCSFTGSLPQIREHLLSTRNPQVCYSQRAAQIANRHETTLSCCASPQDNLETLTRAFELTQRSLRRHEAIISTLAESLSKTKIVCDILCRDRQIFCFNFAILLSREPSEQHKVVNGVPLRIQVSVVGLEDEPFLCVSVAGSDIEVHSTRWPLKKCISVQILDMHGEPVASQDVVTFEDGDYAHDSFIDPSLDPSSQGVCFFMSLADVLRFYPSDGFGYLLISASIGDINN